MQKHSLKDTFHTVKEANTILTKAGQKMLKNSFKTAKEIASLYKDAGNKSFTHGKELVKKTWKLSFNNQKELIKTSTSAVREIINNIKKQKGNGELSSNGRKPRTIMVKSKEEITIDDMLN